MENTDRDFMLEGGSSVRSNRRLNQERSQNIDAPEEPMLENQLTMAKLLQFMQQEFPKEREERRKEKEQEKEERE